MMACDRKEGLDDEESTFNSIDVGPLILQIILLLILIMLVTTFLDALFQMQ